MLRRLSFATLLVALAFIATPAMAQTTNGVIAGIASDAQGGVLPGVRRGTSPRKRTADSGWPGFSPDVTNCEPSCRDSAP
jgi:hypothetical protein